MYKLLIVDDEEMIRDGMVKGIPWNDLGFEVVGQACNGLEAVDIVNELLPDVVLTDIRMPDMDGIELMEYLAGNYPSIKMIVLSGYNDFEYLKSSIKSNVYDYLLKPTRISEFVDLFRKLKLVIDEEKRKEQEYEELKKSLIENLPYLEQIFLNQLVIGFYNDIEEIEDKKKFYKIVFLEGKLAIVILEIDSIQSIAKEISEEKMQLLKLYIIQIANKIVSDTIRGRFFIGNDGSIIGICCMNSGTKSLINAIREIQKNVFEYRKLNLSAGISNEFENILEINMHFGQARQAIKQKLCLGSQCVILFSDIENVYEMDVPVLHLEVNVITDYILTGKKNDISYYIRSNFTCLKNKMFKSFEFLDSSILKLLFELDSYFYQYGISVRKVLEENYSGLQEIYHIDTLEHKAEWLVSILSEIAEKVCASRSDRVTRIIGEVKRYLEKNFTSNGVCLEFVADIFKKSPPYLSKLFKEETGVNFSDFLARLRMEKAKELLLDVKIKVHEVPSMVGYVDISHFSKKFKTYTGMSPAQFRSE